MKTEENQQIADNSLGQILREKRQFLKIEIVEISAYLKIKSRDIAAIENNDLKHITKHLYVPGLIRSYAKFLKIDPKLVEKKIKVLPIASNTENKKHQLLNIGESDQLSPNKDSVFNFLLISILLFLALLLLYNSFQNNDAFITNEKLIHELENMDS
jgi:cytoskeletal protein RodZ